MGKAPLLPRCPSFPCLSSLYQEAGSLLPESAQVPGSQILVFPLMVASFLKASSRLACSEKLSRPLDPILLLFLSHSALQCTDISMLLKKYWAERRDAKMATLRLTTLNLVFSPQACKPWRRRIQEAKKCEGPLGILISATDRDHPGFRPVRAPSTMSGMFKHEVRLLLL